jgi:hypothetical protein
VVTTGGGGCGVGNKRMVVTVGDTVGVGVFGNGE